MQNIEFKAELRDMTMARAACSRCGAERLAVLDQTDTYFRVPDGRLKKRETAGLPTDYIFYHRPVRSRPKLSRFVLYSEAQARERFGTLPLPVWVVVRKRREYWRLREIRIHLDRVEGLGDFLEFEALVTPQQTLRRCHANIKRLRTAFGPALGEPISCGYADLLAAETEEPRRRYDAADPEA